MSAPSSHPTASEPSGLPPFPKKSWLKKLIKKDTEGAEDTKDFPTIDEVIRTVFPTATKSEFKLHKKHFKSIGDMPVLAISPNPLWIVQHGQNSYDVIMDIFATSGLAPNRRDENSRCLFHFRDLGEMYAVRNALKATGSNAFSVPVSLHAALAAPAGHQLEPIGRAWVISKINLRKSDIGEDIGFFSV